MVVGLGAHSRCPFGGLEETVGFKFGYQESSIPTKPWCEHFRPTPDIKGMLGCCLATFARLPFSTRTAIAEVVAALRG